MSTMLDDSVWQQRWENILRENESNRGHRWVGAESWDNYGYTETLKDGTTVFRALCWCGARLLAFPASLTLSTRLDDDDLSADFLLLNADDFLDIPDLDKPYLRKLNDRLIALSELIDDKLHSAHQDGWTIIGNGLNVYCTRRLRPSQRPDSSMWWRWTRTGLDAFAYIALIGLMATDAPSLPGIVQTLIAIFLIGVIVFLISDRS